MSQHLLAFELLGRAWHLASPDQTELPGRVGQLLDQGLQLADLGLCVVVSSPGLHHLSLAVGPHPSVDREDRRRMLNPTGTITLRIGARVLLLDSVDRVLLIHALDAADPDHHWWELPGGGLDEGEDLRTAARRELAEETGITLSTVERKLWVRESRFRYKGRGHHRIEHVFLGRTPGTAPQVALKPTENEKAGLIERRWFSAFELRQCTDKLLPDSPGQRQDHYLFNACNEK